jgi:leucine dehydrogenase
LLVRRGRRSGLYTIVAVHSTARGPSLGGCRMWTYQDERAAVRDALRLSRAMTFKSAVAGLPLGGGKGVIALPAGTPPPTGEARRAVLLDFGDTVEALAGAYITAEDVGTSEPDIETISEVTSHVSGLAVSNGGSGDPSPWTAVGVEAAIRVSPTSTTAAASSPTASAQPGPTRTARSRPKSTCWLRARSAAC